MNLEKSKKRISKKAKMGFQGYPTLAIEYFGVSNDFANGVSVKFTAEEGAETQEERFKSQLDAREDEVIQSSLVKMIERSGAKSVSVAEHIVVFSE